MPKKYKKPDNPNRKYTHNRPYYGPWWDTTKEARKEGRKFSKALRHKLLFKIPLTEEEKRWVKLFKMTAHSALDREGRVKTGHHSDRWRFLNPKEEKEEKI